MSEPTALQIAERSILPRHSYIGGSSAATILGLNEYQTRYDLWHQKVHRKSLDLSDNNHVKRGNLVEPTIERYVTELIDPTCNSDANWARHNYHTAERKVEERDPGSQIMLMDPELSPVHGLPYIGGHPDGIGDEILWEFKAPTSYKLERVINGGLPHAWFLQVQHYLMISKMPRACVAIWSFDRWEPYLIHMEPDFYIHEQLRDAYRDFWWHVETKTPLPTDQEAVELLGRAVVEQHEVIEDPEVEAILERYKSFYEMRYGAKDAQDAARLELLSHPSVRGRGTVITPGYRATISETKRYGKPSTRLTVKTQDAYE